MQKVRTIFATVGEARSAGRNPNLSMEGKKGQTLQQAPTKLAIAELKTVRWVQGQQTAMEIYQTAAKFYSYLRQLIFIGFFFLISEAMVVWWWTFIHNLPWPQGILNFVHRLDSTLVNVLDSVQQRLEWWLDASGVRLMWFRETVENFLDRKLTTVDHYFAILQDWVLALFNLFMVPFKFARSLASTVLSEKQSTKTAPRLEKIPNGSLRRNSEGYEAEDNEDWGDEEYLSDASLDSRRLMKENSQGESYMRHYTTATAEGKFREAMYVRVSHELGIMRKNSIRFSRGIVNYAKQMVQLRTRRYGETFQELFLRWAKELGILELLLTIQEEMKDRHFLAKPLVLVRVLSEAWLAFLLRLVKGKRSRRTRSFRSESLRRRTLNQPQQNNDRSNSLALSPALQQSSEPVQPHHRLPVAATLEAKALREDDEDLEGFLSKDSALGSEDNRSDETVETGPAVLISSSCMDETLESDSSDLEQHKWNTQVRLDDAPSSPKKQRADVRERSFVSYPGASRSPPSGNSSHRTSILNNGSRSLPPSLRNSVILEDEPDLPEPKKTKQKKVTIQ